jgi:IS30 family transposase
VIRTKVFTETHREFWRLIAAGIPTEDVADSMGVSRTAAKRWFADAGGMSPIELQDPIGRYLSLTERETIALEWAAGASMRQIAKRIGRAPSTVSRELWRNRIIKRPVHYRAIPAQEKANARARRPKPSKLATNPRLCEEVQARLARRLSPQQIVAELHLDFPEDEHMRISHESIYRSLYVQGRGELKRELTRCLRTGRALRKPRRRVQNESRQRNMVMISERPAEAEDRAVPGHWEGDLILGARQESAIGTLVERTTRFVMLLHLPDGHSCEQVRDAVIATMGELPTHLRRSLAWDQGREMSRHAEITIAADLPIYFCDPHSPWQRGTNENTNGLLRQYFPKGTDLSVYPRSYLDFVAAELNGRPRQTLGWRTPARALNELLLSPPKPRVASTG